MAIELKFSKSDLETPWGFRLVGGSDFDQPVVVVKVNENSLAEDAGLQAGDITVRVNETPTARLTHHEVHDLILAAGLEFDLGIRRGEFSTNVHNEEEDYSTEVSKILEAVETDIISEALKQVNEKSELRIETDVSENLAGQEKILTTVESPSESSKEKKWSTFLIKPTNPVPKPKRKVEEEKVKGEPYRVIIKKQPRRAFQEKKVQFDQNVTKVEIEVETEERNETSYEEMTGHKEIENVEVEVKVTETEEVTIEESEGNDEDEYNEYEKEVEEETQEHNQGDSIETEFPWANIKIDTSIESSSSLQQQLLAVQKQLQALSQLPSTIQVTLDAISKQLAVIVDTKENSIKNGEKDEGSSSTKDEDEPLTEEEILEETEETSEKAEAEVNGGDLEENSSSIEEEMEEDVVKEDRIEEERQKEDEEEEEKEPDPYEGLTEEEREAAIKREQVEAKKLKGMEGRTPKPIQRPIILPGGRRWSTPEDAIPTFRKPKMSDEKIIETIESNLEVIAGKRKGESNCWMVPSKVVATKRINFLKYQPPPRNLDYLQRSEVYRLVHDMEPPVRGITSRAERIPAVQDYYEATKGGP